MKTFKERLSIAAFFMVMALTITFIPWHSGFIYSGSDVRFHVNRIIELVDSLGKGYPLVNFHSFNGVGYDVNSFYPSVLLYLAVPFFALIHNPINAFYIMLTLLIIMTEVSAYLSARALKMSVQSALMTSVVFTFSGYMLFVYLFAFELGEAIAFIAFPPLMLALLSYFFSNKVTSAFKKYRDMVLVVCLAWITYAHLLSTLLSVVITGVLLFTYTIVKRNWHILFRFGILAINYVLITSFYWFNFFNAYLYRDVVGPDNAFVIMPIKTLILNSLANRLAPGSNDPITIVGLGIIPFVCVVLLLVNLKQLDSLQRVLLAFSIVFIILSTDLFCWSFLQAHIVNISTFQFTYRFLIITELTVSFAICLYLKPSWILVIVISLCIGIFNINNSFQFTSMGRQQETLSWKPSQRHEPIYADFKVNAKNFRHLYDGYYGKKGGPADYLDIRQQKNFAATSSKKILLNHSTVHPKMISGTNCATYMFHMAKRSSISLPVWKTTYRYQVVDNGKIVNASMSHYGTLRINNLHAGMHRIEVKVIPTRVFYLSLISTALGIFMLGFLARLSVLKSDNLRGDK